MLLLRLADEARASPLLRTIQAFIDASTPTAQGVETFPWSSAAARSTIDLRYCVLAPSAN